MAKGKSSGDKKSKKKHSAAAGDGDDGKTSKSLLRAERKKSKGKKFTVDDDSVKIMRKTLADIGCKLNEVEADGNCLFRALGDQLFGDQQQHVEIRKRVVDYIESKRTDFEPFMEDEETFDHYCKRMREESTWGGNQELYAAARLFSVYIVIHQESSRMVIECDAQKPKSVIHIAYHGSDHYDSVRSLRDTDMNAPPMEIELAVDGFRPDDLKQRWKAQKSSSVNDAASMSPRAPHQIATSHGDPTTPSLDDATSDLDALSLHAIDCKKNRSSAVTQVVLSKKAQRLLKKQTKSKASASAPPRAPKSAMSTILDQ